MKGIEKLAGEPQTDYVPVSTTPGEKCKDCEHFVPSENGCNGPKMKKLSQQPRLDDGNVLVVPDGWCKFFEEAK